MTASTWVGLQSRLMDYLGSNQFPASRIPISPFLILAHPGIIGSGQKPGQSIVCFFRGPFVLSLRRNRLGYDVNDAHALMLTISQREKDETDYAGVRAVIPMSSASVLITITILAIMNQPVISRPLWLVCC